MLETEISAWYSKISVKPPYFAAPEITKEKPKPATKKGRAVYIWKMSRLRI